MSSGPVLRKPLTYVNCLSPLSNSKTQSLLLSSLSLPMEKQAELKGRRRVSIHNWPQLSSVSPNPTERKPCWQCTVCVRWRIYCVPWALRKNNANNVIGILQPSVNLKMPLTVGWRCSKINYFEVLFIEVWMVWLLKEVEIYHYCPMTTSLWGPVSGI